MPARPHRQFLAVAFLAAATAACSNSSSNASGAAAGPGLEVVGVSPADGAAGVEPGAEVLVTFGELVSGLLAEDLVVADGAGSFQGQIDASPDGRTWRFRPAVQMPRGSRIEVRVRAGLAAGSGVRLQREFRSAFTVRDGGSTLEVALRQPQPGAMAAMAWPDGRRAIADGAELLPLDGSLVARSLPMPGEARAFGNDARGGFSAVSVLGASPYALDVVRGNLLGPALVHALPAPSSRFGRVELAHNLLGDVAVYCYGVLPNQQGVERLWWSRAGSALWADLTMSAAGPYPLRHIALDSAGHLFVAQIDGLTGRLQLVVHEPATLSQTTFDVGPAPDNFHVGGAGFGGVLAWRETRSTSAGPTSVLQARRYGAAGLDPAVVWQQGETRIERAFAVADSGAVAVVSQAGGTAYWLQRIEADGAVGAPGLVHDGRPVTHISLATSARGEAWIVLVRWAADGRDELVLVKSRPGAEAAEPVLLHRTAEPGLRIREVSVALDATGRGVVVFTEDRAATSPHLAALRIE